MVTLYQGDPKVRPNHIARYFLRLQQPILLALCGFSSRNIPICMAFMGFDEDAENFCCSIEVGGNGRKPTWQGVSRSIRDSHKTVRDNLDGLIIYEIMALYFFDGDSCRATYGESTCEQNSLQ